MGIFLPLLRLFCLGFSVMLRSSSASLAGGYFDGINAIYSFGDSFTDTGNFIRETKDATSFACYHLPYGETTFKKPTGRCSNGLLMIDYLALALHLPLLPPYLDKHENFTHGVNFAVSGATALDNSFFLKRGIKRIDTNSTLSVQIQWFKNHLKSNCSSDIECKHSLANALFLIGVLGGNDYSHALLYGMSLEEVMDYMPYVVERIMDATKAVVDGGAVKVVVPGLFPFGCFPIFLVVYKSPNRAAYDEHGCLKRMNRFARLHNAALSKAIETLRLTNQNVLFVYADYYNAFIYLLKNAIDLGFDVKSLLKACCGSFGDEYNILAGDCGYPGVRACENPTKQIFWDGQHFTQEANKIITQKVFNGAYIKQKLQGYEKKG